jgi:DNA repair exonuclease SbcCD ATPase subunit
VEYFVSAHPRQNINDLIVDCPIIQSNAFSTKQQLGESTILISRFSTLIYEAVAAGRKVVYYNPHNEPYKLFHGGYEGMIYEAKSQEELKLIITTILEDPKIKNENWDTFMNCHLGTSKKDASTRCAEALKNLDLANTQDNLALLVSQSHELQFSIIKSNTWLAEQYDSLTKEVKNLNSLLKEKDRWLDEVVKAKDWLVNQSDVLTNEVVRLNDLMIEKDNWINEVENAKDWLANQSQQLTNEVAKLNELLAKKDRWIDELENAKDWLNEQIELLTTEVKQLNNLLAHKEQWILEVENAKNWLVEQNKELTFEVKNLHDKLKSRENNIKELTQEINRLQSVFYYLKSRFGKNKNEN